MDLPLHARGRPDHSELRLIKAGPILPNGVQAPTTPKIERHRNQTQPVDRLNLNKTRQIRVQFTCPLNEECRLTLPAMICRFAPIGVLRFHQSKMANRKSQIQQSSRSKVLD